MKNQLKDKPLTDGELARRLRSLCAALKNHPKLSHITDKETSAFHQYAMALLELPEEHVREGLVNEQEMILIFCRCASYLANVYLVHSLEQKDA